MRLSTLLAIVASLAIYSAANPEPACAACSVVPCTVSNQCGAACSCLITGIDTFGTCVELK